MNQRKSAGTVVAEMVTEYVEAIERINGMMENL